MTSIYMILMFVLDLLWFLVIANIIVSWLINFEVLNPRQPLVHHIWASLSRIMEPIYGPIRRLLPSTGGLDFSPMVVILGLYAIRVILINNAAAFY